MLHRVIEAPSVRTQFIDDAPESPHISLLVVAFTSYDLGRTVGQRSGLLESKAIVLGQDATDPEIGKLAVIRTSCHQDVVRF